MISKISLNSVASYTDLLEINPSPINYLYGGNGTGKTTLSNVIQNPDNYSNCCLDWSNDSLDTLVYNRNFVETNFGQSKSIKGIFTLGKNSVDAYKNILKIKERILYLNKQVESLDKVCKTLDIDIQKVEEVVTEKCWNVKIMFDEVFKPAITGSIGKKKTFLDRCVNEMSINHCKLLSKEDIIEKCNTIFSNSLKVEEIIPPFTIEPVLIEPNDILSEPILGKENLGIAKLIKKLQNSDWVKQGQKYLGETEGLCPFCQQDIVNSTLQKSIEEFFDEEYERKCINLKDFREEYNNVVNKKLQDLRLFVSRDSKMFPVSILIDKAKLLKEVFKVNLSTIDKKIELPSSTVSIEPITDILEDIQGVVENFIKIVERNNQTIANLNTEKNNLKREIWRFITDILKVDLKHYLDESDLLIKRRESIFAKKEDYQAEVVRLLAQIKGLESEVTDVTHTINEINKILRSFSFTGFSLAEASEKNFYKIIRGDGSEGHQTLSEGEYRFITFLYFYQLLKGSNSSSGVIKDRVVVFDDPISSLDSSVLFVVSNLVKEVVKDCREKRGGIKQIFILTHNVYFYKEVTFRGNKHKSKWIEESFWLIRKKGDKSQISLYTENPIKTTYELLWKEIADNSEINRVTIFNTLRRILEYYFNIIGGLDYEKCLNDFEGEEKLVCRSLVSWINDGSHFINDDLVMHTDEEEIDKYLDVFKMIFQKMGHKSHYDMMMKAYSTVNIDVLE